MAARKLQTEIDRTLKKVSEGVELFEGIYEKMQASTNQAQKEKLEAELKTQIKRLQRMRDQIKTWVAGNDIKDKSLLLDNRKLIETQMEKFKACEKEMKTKAYSKIGLNQSAALDPKEQEKEETAQWLRGQVEALQMQVEQAEAEIESLQGTSKKRNKASSAAGRQEQLEVVNERRKWHISRLEIVLRLLDNGSMPTQKVLDLKADVSYFVEGNADEELDEYEGLYDDLNLDEEEAKFGLVGEEDESDESDRESEVRHEIPPRTPNKKIVHDDEPSKPHESPVLRKASASIRKASVDASSKPPPNPNFAQQPMSSIVKAGLSTTTPSAPRPPVQLPPVKYAAAAAAAVASQPAAAVPSTPIISSTPSQSAPSPAASNPPPAAPSIPPSSATSATTPSMQDVTASPSLTHPSTISPMLSSAASVSIHRDGSFHSGQESPALSEALAGAAVTPSESEAPTNGVSQVAPLVSSPLQQQQLPAQTSMDSSTIQQPQFPPGMKPPPQAQASASSPADQVVGAQMALAPEQQQLPVQRPASSPLGVLQQQQFQQQQQQQQQRSAAPSSQFPALSDLVASFENVKQKAPHRMANLDQVNKMLEGSHANHPEPRDAEKPKYYIPRNPAHSAPYYPQTPSTLLTTPALFAQLDVDTLFFVFYYFPGTYQQYLAAKELKRQSWRFHTKYKTWFQRHSEPQAITEEYEQGVYVYFDWEGSWCQRKKCDFRFEYRYLSED